MDKQIIETKLIFLPKNIKIYKKNNNILLTTPTGFIRLIIPINIKLQKKKNYVYVDVIKTDLKNQTWISNVSNLIKGLSREYFNRIILKGVGYKTFLINSNTLELKIGYSHSIKYRIQKDISTKVFKNSIIQISSPFKEKLGQLGSSLRSLKKADVYKGKGILYNREKINLKIGKKA